MVCDFLTGYLILLQILDHRYGALQKSYERKYPYTDVFLSSRPVAMAGYKCCRARVNKILQVRAGDYGQIPYLNLVNIKPLAAEQYYRVNKIALLAVAACSLDCLLQPIRQQTVLL